MNYKIFDEILVEIQFYILFYFQNFTSDFGGVTQEGIFSKDSSKTLNEAIAVHLLRTGQLDIVERFIQVGKIS